MTDMSKQPENINTSGERVNGADVQTVRIAVADCKNDADIHKALEEGMYWIAGPLESEFAGRTAGETIIDGLNEAIKAGEQT
jgi:hypothetical protein